MAKYTSTYKIADEKKTTLFETHFWGCKAAAKMYLAKFGFSAAILYDFVYFTSIFHDYFVTTLTDTFTKTISLTILSFHDRICNLPNRSLLSEQRQLLQRQGSPQALLANGFVPFPSEATIQTVP